MIAKLNKELSQAVRGREQIEVVDPATGCIYVIMERSAFDLTHRQQVHAAIQQGIESMEAGGGIPLAEADDRLRQHLGLPPRQ